MSLRRRTDAYWQKRAEQRLLASERVTKKHMQQMARIYAEARRRTVKSLQDIYAAYYKKDEGFDMDALRSIVPNSEIKKFLKEMQRLGLSTSLPKNYDGRVKRLKLINAQLEAEAKMIGAQQERIDREALIQNFTDSYYHAGFDVAKGIGSTPVGFDGLDEQTVKQVLNAKFEGKNFSKRIWANTDLLADRLKQTLSVAIANGQGIQKTAAEMRRDFNVNRSYAERLIRTESNHFHNSAELAAYKQMGFDHFKFLATLDNRTSEICRDMDGKVFKVEDGIPGDNVPPLHPNCRSTIVPYFKDYEPETRLYRDPETGKNGFTYNVPYDEWRQSLKRPDRVESNDDGMSESEKKILALKKEQFEIIQKFNPMTDDYHTGIRSVDDIKTALEAFKTKANEDEDFLYPDFTQKMAEEALENGKLWVYSSHDFTPGCFVTPSPQMARDYAGDGKVYKRVVSLDDVAWIDSNEGQLATTKKPKSYIREDGTVEPGFYVAPLARTDTVIEVLDRYAVPSYSYKNEEAQISYGIDSERTDDHRHYIYKDNDAFKNGYYEKLNISEKELIANLDKYLKDGGTYGGVDRQEERFLSAYTHASAPNEGLRKGMKLEDVPMAKEVMNVMNRTVGIPGTFYRGLNDPTAAKSILGMKVGEIYSDKGFMSTDWNKETATEKFGGGGVILEITNKSRKPGTNLSLAPYTHAFDESEVIFAPNTKMRIVGIKKEGSKTVYKLEVIEKD